MFTQHLIVKICEMKLDNSCHVEYLDYYLHLSSWILNVSVEE